MRMVIDADLVVHMRTGGPTGGAEKTDLLVKPDFLAERNVDTVQMRVSSANAMAVLDLDHEAVGALTAGEDDAAGGGRRHRRVQRRPEIDPFMHCALTAERVGSAPEGTGHREILERRCKRHGA